MDGSGGHLAAGIGLLNRAGTTGGYGTSQCNFIWNGGIGAVELYIDAQNLGPINVTSDYRIKKDIADLSSTWDAVKALHPISYTQADYGSQTREGDSVGPLFVADDIERWGFIAHELQETLTPSAAFGVKDDPDQVQQPNAMAVIAALTKALQETMTRLEAVEAQLAGGAR